LYEEAKESKQHLDVVVYTMSSVEGSLDESSAPVTEENAKSPLLAAAMLPAASTEDEELCPCQKAYKESGNKKKLLYLCVLACNAMMFLCSVLKPYHGHQFPKHRCILKTRIFVRKF
jgi:hypothetical protein